MLKKIVSLGFLVASDAAALTAAFLAALLIRRNVLPLIFPSIPALTGISEPFLARAYFVLAWILVMAYEKLYTKRFSHWDETRILIKSSVMAIILILAATVLAQKSMPFSRLTLGLMGLFSFVALPAARFLTKRILVKLRLWEKRVIIIGSRSGAREVIAAIRRNRSLGFRIVGCLTDDEAEVGRATDGIPILGHYDQIEAWKEKRPFEDIIVTFPDISRAQMVELLRRWDGVSETIRYIPQTGDLITAGVEMENIGRVLALSVRKNLHKPWNRLIKAAYEYALAAISFVVFAPVVAVCAAAIKVDSRGPVFFRQERCGRHGKPIRIVKLRTMFVDNEARLRDLLARDARAMEEWARYRKIKGGDPRVTRVGRLLRRLSLDEVPQLLNVLRGEMSIVGPRPLLREEIESIRPYPGILFEVKPGMTGLWQISGRSEVAFEDRIKIDERYVRNWSVWLDLWILARTAVAAIGGRGAF